MEKEQTQQNAITNQKKKKLHERKNNKLKQNVVNQRKEEEATRNRFMGFCEENTQ